MDVDAEGRLWRRRCWRPGRGRLSGGSVSGLFPTELLTGIILWWWYHRMRCGRGKKRCGSGWEGGWSRDKVRKRMDKGKKRWEVCLRHAPKPKLTKKLVLCCAALIPTLYHRLYHKNQWRTPSLKFYSPHKHRPTGPRKDTHTHTVGEMYAFTHKMTACSHDGRYIHKHTHTGTWLCKFKKHPHENKAMAWV